MKGYLVTAVMDGDTFDWIERMNVHADDPTNIIWIKTSAEVEYDEMDGEYEYVTRTDR